jgi:hypothetical protein
MWRETPCIRFFPTYILNIPSKSFQYIQYSASRLLVLGSMSKCPWPCPWARPCTWTYGHMDMWTYGHMDMWTHMDWACGHMDIIDIWGYKDIRTKEVVIVGEFFPIICFVFFILVPFGHGHVHGHTDIWRTQPWTWTYGHMDMWTYGHMDMRTYGHMDMWTHMDWTCGHIDIIDIWVYKDIRTKEVVIVGEFFPLICFVCSMYTRTFCRYTFCPFIPFVVIRFVSLYFSSLYVLSLFVLSFYTFCRYTFCPFIPFVVIRYVFRCFVVIRSVVICFVVIPFVIEPDVLARGGPCRSKYSSILFPFSILLNKLLIIL